MAPFLAIPFMAPRLLGLIFYLPRSSEFVITGSMKDYSEYPNWVHDAKVCLKWFIDVMGDEEWVRRRSQVVAYFQQVAEATYGQSSTSSVTVEPGAYQPMAVYDDWIGWYMYLVECLVDRPTCDEPMQSARVYPFFASIGKQVNSLKSVVGVDKRILELLNQKQNQPDPTLYELIVAACYCRNGWDVGFIEEHPSTKTPDFWAKKDGRVIQVECKRMAKTTAYAEEERQDWLRRWKRLNSRLTIKQPSLHLKVRFKVPVRDTQIDVLLDLFEAGYQNSDTYEFSTSNDFVELKVEEIDMSSVNAHFEKYHVKSPSPQMIKLLAGEYIPTGNYTMMVVPESVAMIGEDDGLHACDAFYTGIKHAFSAEWTCDALESIDAKAKEARRVLRKALGQMQDGMPGVIHIGYETLSGSFVEFARHSKIAMIVNALDVGSKDIKAVFFNAFQCVASVDQQFECAETTLSFGNSNDMPPDEILAHQLMLDRDDTQAVDDTHWRQDFEKIL